MIELQNICKSYKVARRSAGLGEAVKSLFRREYTRVDALNDVSFTVRDGEMVGYIGPNGAGKSSTIKIMSGVLTPDSGTCVINGRVPWKERTAHVREIGVVFGQRSQLWWDVPVADSFELLRDIYRVDGAAYRKTLSRLTELLELGERVARARGLAREDVADVGAVEGGAEDGAAGGAEDVAHVVDDARRRGRRERGDRHAREQRAHDAEARVVGAEVVAPLAAAVRLVHRKQRDPPRARRRLQRYLQPPAPHKHFGRHIQQLWRHFSSLSLLMNTITIIVTVLLVNTNS